MQQAHIILPLRSSTTRQQQQAPCARFHPTWQHSRDCRAQAYGWQEGRSCPSRPSLTSQLKRPLRALHRNRDQQQEQSHYLTSGWSLSELPRAALASQTQSTGRKDRGSLNTSKKSRLWKALQILLAPRNPEYAAACSHSLKPGQENKPSQQELLQQPGKSGGGSYQKNLTPRPSSSVIISALCSCCKACRARSSIVSSKPWNSREGQRSPSTGKKKNHIRKQKVQGLLAVKQRALKSTFRTPAP